MVVNEWDRQDKEAATTFALFTIYRDMHPSLRTLKAVMELDPAKRSYNTLRAFSQDHQWPSRAAAYDAMLDEKRQVQTEQSRRRANEKFLKAGELMLDKSLAYIEMMDPAKIGPQYLPRIADAAVKLVREGTGRKDDSAKPASFEQTIADLNKAVSQK